MAGTQGELLTLVYDVIGVSPNDGQLPEAVVNRQIMRALHDIETERDWPWLQAVETITTTSGDDSYPLNASWRRTIQVRIADEYTLRQRSIGDLTEHWDEADRGRPEEYAIFGDEIMFRATPGAAYAITHRYLKREPELANNASTPLLPVEYHGAVADRAAVYCLRRLREEQRAAAAEASFQQWMARMRDDVRRNQAPSRVRVRSEWGV